MNTLFKTVTSRHCGSQQVVANDTVIDLESADCIFIKDMVFNAYIGVYDEEKGLPQKLTASVDVLVSTGGQDYMADDINDIMSYKDIVDAIEQVKSEGHIHLLEHFAEKVAELCLQNPKALQVKITLNKHNKFGTGELAGVMLTRCKATR